MDELIDKLLEHLWLNHRLSQNTLQSYRRDLEKVAARLRQGGKDWFGAAAEDLAAAVYVPEEKASSQARALSACKRLYAWLEETEKRADNPTRFLTSPHKEQPLPGLITEAQIENCLPPLMSIPLMDCATKRCSKSCMLPVCALLKP